MSENNIRLVRIYRPKRKGSSMNNWTSVIRNLLLMLGTWVATQGWMSEAEWAQIVGAILVIGVAVWKFIVSRIRKSELADAIEAPAAK